MNILLQLLLILFLAKIFAEIIERAGFPGILGEMAAGIFLGMLWINPDDDILSFFSMLGAIFLLFIVGYKEINLQEVKASIKIALIPTLCSVIVPFSFGFLLGKAFNLEFIECLFIGVAFSPTSIGVSVRTLIDLDYLSKKIGSTMLSSAILDDIIGIFMFSVLISIATYHHIPTSMQLMIIGGKFVIFLIIMIILGWKVFPVLFTYIHKMQVKESIFAFVFMIAIFSAYLAEVFSLHAVIGAFIGGACLSSIPFAKIEDVQNKVSGISYGIFVPIFFAYIGLSIDLSAIQGAGLFALLVIVLALSSKLIGGFIGTKIAGFNSYDSLIFGVGMMPRAGVELVFISAGRGLGIIGDEIFSAIVLMIVVSVIVSPALLKLVIEYKERSVST
ncbi:MAG: glutathione-regulated potassium-efflux system protein KefC [ANME-2 cluster archaeon HR1]|nr:MAG: glutathione-regulated potassium-efflux system protein KefC [ANME-2 cluster archaeon HR1]